MTDVVQETAAAPPAAAVKTRRVAVLGTAPSSRASAPFGPIGAPLAAQGWEIWCIGLDPAGVTPRWERWYEIHDPAWLIDRFNNPAFEPANVDHVRRMAELAEKGANIVLMRPSDLIPHAKRFIPRARIEATFGTDFLTSSIAWMMAEAILELEGVVRDGGKAEIGLWGIDMAQNEEYAEQRPGVLFFKREALLRGIDVVLPPQSDLFFAGTPYPDNVESPLWRKYQARRREVMHRLGVAQQTNNRAQLDAATQMGALQELDWLCRTLTR